jgi:hypothetical protein
MKTIGCCMNARLLRKFVSTVDLRGFVTRVLATLILAMAIPAYAQMNGPDPNKVPVRALYYSAGESLLQIETIFLDNLSHRPLAIIGSLKVPEYSGGTTFPTPKIACSSPKQALSPLAAFAVYWVVGAPPPSDGATDVRPKPFYIENVAATSGREIDCVAGGDSVCLFPKVCMCGSSGSCPTACCR